MDRQNLGVAFGARRVRVDVQLAKMLTKRFLLLQIDLLIAEEQHLMLEQVAGMLLDGQVGGVGDVEAVLFGPFDQRVFQAEEVA